MVAVLLGVLSARRRTYTPILYPDCCPLARGDGQCTKGCWLARSSISSLGS